MKKKLEPLPGTERQDEALAVGGVPTGDSFPAHAGGDDGSALIKAKDRRLALRKKKLAEDAVLISEELRASTATASRALAEISERVVAMEHDTVGSGEAASAIIEAADAGRDVAESFRNKATSTGQALSTLSMITHGILGDVQGFKQLTDRLTRVNDRTARYMSHLRSKGEQIAGEVAKAHEYADEINVLAFNMRLETSRIGDEAAAISVVAKHFHSITKQAEEAATQIQQHQLGFNALIEQVATAVASLQREATQQREASSQLVLEVGKSIEQMRSLQEMGGNVRTLAGEVDEILTEFGRNAGEIRRGLEEVASSITEISAGIHEQSASMAEIAGRAAKLDALGADFKQNGSVESIEAINKHMVEGGRGIQLIRTTIHQSVDAIHQIAAAAAQQQTLSLGCSEQLGQISALGDGIQGALVDTQQAVEQLTAGLVAGRKTVAEVLAVIAGYDEKSDTILGHMDGLRETLDGIEQALGRLLDYSMVITTTGFSGEIEAARLGADGEMFASISSDVSLLGDLSASVARKALTTTASAKERIDLLKRSVFDVGEIVRTTSEQRRAAEVNLMRVATETQILLDGTNESVALIEHVQESFMHMATRMEGLTTAADRVVDGTSETMAFVRQQVELFDELGATVAAFSEHVGDDL